MSFKALHGIYIIRVASKDLIDHTEALEILLLAISPTIAENQNPRACLYRQPLKVAEGFGSATNTGLKTWGLLAPEAGVYLPSHFCIPLLRCSPSYKQVCASCCFQPVRWKQRSILLCKLAIHLRFFGILRHGCLAVRISIDIALVQRNGARGLLCQQKGPPAMDQWHALPEPDKGRTGTSMLL